MGINFTIDHKARHVEARAGGVVEMFAGTDEHFALSQRFINLGRSDRPARVFRSEDEARKWLEAQPEV